MSVENQAITEALACNEGSASDDRKGEECILEQCKRKEAWVQVEIEFEIEIEIKIKKDTSIPRYDSMKVYCKLYTESWWDPRV